jgi:hypothetical protein
MTLNHGNVLGTAITKPNRHSLKSPLGSRRFRMLELIAVLNLQRPTSY